MGKLMKKLTVLGIIFVLAIAGAFFYMRRPPKNDSLYTNLDEASLPVVAMRVNESLLNELYGYVDEMDTRTMRDAITPLPEDRNLGVSINLYGNHLKGISYEIRSLDTERLVERTTVDTWQTSGDQASAVLPIQNLISRDTEYVLSLNLQMEGGRSINYYTRILWQSQSHVQEYLDFAAYFSTKTFDKENAAELKTYLESNSQGDNSSLARVDIHSSFSQVVWGDMQVARAGEASVTIKELNGPLGYIELEYMVTAPGAGDVVEQYEVRENFCIKWTAQRMYLMAYERTMDQLFNASAATISGRQIELGISTGDRLDCRFSPSGNIAAFIIGREIWSYDQEANQAVRVFGFRSGSDDGIRSGHREHGIQLVSVNDDGGVDFLVYGYMNRGSHEGEVGVAFYRYDVEDNAIQELIYVPTRKSYEFLREDLGTLSYVNAAQQLYLLFDHSVYAIDLAGNEFMVIAQNLPVDGYAISGSSRMLAWQEGSDVSRAKTINLMNLDSGRRVQITAGEGEVVRVLGFVDEDFIYGTARESDVVRDGQRVVTFPMYAVDIVDENKTVEAHYERSGVYVSGVSVRDSRIHLLQIAKSDSGEFVPVEEDILVSNAAAEEDKGSGIQTGRNDIKKKTYYIGLKNAVETTDPLKVTAPRKVAALSGGTLNLGGQAQGGADRFYAYANGSLVGGFVNFKKAVDAIYDSMGLVTDSSQELIWIRGTRNLTKNIPVDGSHVAQSKEEELSTCLDVILRKEGKGVNVAEQLAAGKGALAILEENLDCRVIDAAGCTLNQMLYFVYQGTPVLASLKDGGALLLVGYDQYNVVIFNPQTGTTYKMGQNDATAFFEGQDNRFVCYRMEE